MNCETMRERLLDFVDGTLDETRAAECRAHLSTCTGCTRAAAHHRATAQLLEELPPLGEDPSEAIAPARLRWMAATVLATASAEPAAESAAHDALLPGRAGAPGKIVPLARATLIRRRLLRVASAAVILLSAAFGAELLLRNHVDPSAGDEPPAFVSDPEFVGDFEVLRDLSVADSSDGELLDLDHDDIVMLQLLQDV
jgi:anti-sigma factor RsiW